MCSEEKIKKKKNVIHLPDNPAPANPKTDAIAMTPAFVAKKATPWPKRVTLAEAIRGAARPPVKPESQK